jgi:hypothetical protein
VLADLMMDAIKRSDRVSTNMETYTLNIAEGELRQEACSNLCRGTAAIRLR